MRLTFRLIFPPLMSAMLAAFEDAQGVDIQFADIFSPGEFDAIVSPANSHGWMDGGIDLLYMRRFGLPLQDRLLKLINERPGRIVKIGEAISVATGDSAIPHMICAPTMFVPEPVPQSDNAYLALSAALKVAREQGYEHILCPGLATGIGRMAPAVAAAQMRRAWDERSET